MWPCVKSDLVLNEKSKKQTKQKKTKTKNPKKLCLKQSQKTLFEIIFCFSFYYRKKESSNTESDTVFLLEHDTEAISVS